MGGQKRRDDRRRLAYPSKVLYPARDEEGRNEVELLAYYRPTDRDAIHAEVNVNTNPIGPLGPALGLAPEAEKDRNTEEFVSWKYYDARGDPPPR